PSGDLHIGHWYIKTPTDALARFHRMHGENVFLPIGFDAFGLPAENAAIRNRINPRDWTMRNIENMRRQLRSMGATFDWDAEVIFTTAPDESQPGGDELRVFTTRPDTLFGATFMVVAPEHPLVERLTSPAQRDAVMAYATAAGRATEIERLSTDREKTGVPL